MAIASAAEPRAAADLMQRWWEAHPRSFHVAKDPAGGMAAFYCLIEPGDVDTGLLATDPVAAAWSDHLRREPLVEGQRALFLRRWLGRGTGEALTPEVASCWLDVKRTYMEMRPDLARLYTVVRDPGGYPYGALSLLPLPEATIEIDDVTYHTLMLEFGEGSVDGWLARMIGVELGADDPDGIAALPEGTVTIMFTDIVDSTALTERLGDAEFRALARTLESGMRSSIGATGGAVVEGMLLGDGIMAVFTSARQAIECACRGVDLAHATGLEIRVGLHSGDVTRDGASVYGGAVNIAARVAGLASPGEVLVSETVRALARTSAGVRFDDRGEQRLKGVADAQRVHAVIRSAAAESVSA
jgi:class 3 adenylate cyclase